MTAESAPVAHRPGPAPADPAILVETQHLTKRYGARITAVDGVSLTIRRGEVYGLLGPNGAGKTTMLRLLLGLIRPTSGTAYVCGALPGTPAGLAGVGALVEAPAFYPYLSGRENLRVIAGYTGAPAARIEAALARVELSTRAHDRYDTYSLGMKQRLGVAAALLKDPALLILDEPTNGLDPRGIAEMRALIRAVGQCGQAVLLSSHLLGEVEQLCDRVGVLQQGRLIAEGAVAALRDPCGLIVRVEPLTQAHQVLLALAGVRAVQVQDGALRATVDPAQAAEVNRRLVEAGLAVSELRPVHPSLEEVFFGLTNGTGSAGRSER